MPENVTGFQPTRNLKNSLIDLAYFDMLPCPAPTFFREEPNKISRSVVSCYSLALNSDCMELASAVIEPHQAHSWSRLACSCALMTGILWGHYDRVKNAVVTVLDVLQVLDSSPILRFIYPVIRSSATKDVIFSAVNVL